MGFRFSRRITVLPGVRVNLGMRGASLSVGPRGASVTMGKKGVYGNVGLPGTGLSYRSRLDRPPPPPRPKSAQLPERLTATLEDNAIRFADEAGVPLDPSLHGAARRMMKDALRDFLDTTAAGRNLEMDLLGQLHHDIPTTDEGAVGRAGKPERDAYPSQPDYMQALMTWRAQGANEGPDPDTLETALLERLGALAWPRETNIAIALRGRRLLLDVDLPEIEDMPERRWAANHSQALLVEKPLSQKQVATIYLGHVCAILCRLAGHGFSVSGFIETVAISGYTQRSSATGRLSDEYVIVADISRADWTRVDRTQLAIIDPENLLRTLGARFEANARGVLKVQVPLE